MANFLAQLTSIASRTLMLMLLVAAGCASKPQAAVEATAAAFWPPFPDQPRVQFLTSYSKSTDVKGPESGFDQLIYGKETQQVLPINKPYGVAIHDGKIYTCDTRKGTVTVFDLRKHQTLVLGKSMGDALQSPTHICIAPDGMKYVADLGQGMIFVYDQQDRHVATFGQKNAKPVGVAVYQNELFVCDYEARLVQVLDRTSGQVLRTIGGPGTDPGQFMRPLGIAADSQGNIYVADVMKCQIQKFSRDGKLISSFGTLSAKTGGLVRPKHLAVDKEGIIWVVDAGFQNVQLFDQQGRLLTFFGSAGKHPGAMYLPAGIAVSDEDLDLFKQYVHPAFDARRLVIVTNQFGDNKISVYAFGKLKDGFTVNDIANTKGLVPDGTSAPKDRFGTTLPSEPGLASPTTASAAPALSSSIPIPGK